MEMPLSKIRFYERAKCMSFVIAFNKLLIFGFHFILQKKQRSVFHHDQFSLVMPFILYMSTFTVNFDSCIKF